MAAVVRHPDTVVALAVDIPEALYRTASAVFGAASLSTPNPDTAAAAVVEAAFANTLESHHHHHPDRSESHHRDTWESHHRDTWESHHPDNRHQRLRLHQFLRAQYRRLPE